MTKLSFVFALVEDRRQEQFLYRFLLLGGMRRDEIAIDVSPKAHGAAESWVRENFARYAKKCRTRNARAATGMFVMLDADRGSVREHLGELDAALIASGQHRIDPKKDNVARLIPKWSVETWILFMSAKSSGEPSVREDVPYKDTKTSEQWSALLPQAVLTLYQWMENPAVRPVGLLDSLQAAIQEIPRALPEGR